MPAPDGPLVRKHIFFLEEDWNWLEAHFGPKSERPIGTSASIRLIIRKYREGIEARAGGKRPELREHA